MHGQSGPHKPLSFAFSMAMTSNSSRCYPTPRPSSCPPLLYLLLLLLRAAYTFLCHAATAALACSSPASLLLLSCSSYTPLLLLSCSSFRTRTLAILLKIYGKMQTNKLMESRERMENGGNILWLSERANEKKGKRKV